MNVPETETGTVLCCASGKDPGTILWFSMATRFYRAALSTDALGKDAIMLIGNGVAGNQAEEMTRLISEFPALREYLSRSETVGGSNLFGHFLEPRFPVIG